MDRRTYTARWHRQRLCIASRGKNRTVWAYACMPHRHIPGGSTPQCVHILLSRILIQQPGRGCRACTACYATVPRRPHHTLEYRTLPHDILPPDNFPPYYDTPPAVKVKIWKLALTHTLDSNRPTTWGSDPNHNPNPNRPTGRGIIWKLALTRIPDPNRRGVQTLTR